MKSSTKFWICPALIGFILAISFARLAVLQIHLEGSKLKASPSARAHRGKELRPGTIIRALRRYWRRVV